MCPHVDGPRLGTGCHDAGVGSCCGGLGLGVGFVHENVGSRCYDHEGVSTMAGRTVERSRTTTASIIDLALAPLDQTF